MNDVNIAYCTAVNFFDTKLVRKAILIVPTSPAAKLSNPTIKDNSDIFDSVLATNAKNKFVISTLRPPNHNALNKAILLINSPPTKNPITAPKRATVFTRAPISVFEKPKSK